MIRTVFASTLLSSILLIVQTTWLKQGLFFGILPDFALLVVVWVAYRNSHVQGALAAFLTGLVCDLLSSSPLGYFAFLYLLPAYAAFKLRLVLQMDGFLLPVAFGIIASLMKALASILLGILFRGQNLPAYSFADYHLWVETVLSGLLAPLVFLLLNRMKPLLVTKKVTE
jgi:rod shape-determining protein MreD